MIDDVYLVFTDKGVISMTKRPPKLRSGEYTVELRVEVPDTFFDQPHPKATLVVPSDAIISPVVVASRSAYDRTFGDLKPKP